MRLIFSPPLRRRFRAAPPLYAGRYARHAAAARPIRPRLRHCCFSADALERQEKILIIDTMSRVISLFFRRHYFAFVVFFQIFRLLAFFAITLFFSDLRYFLMASL